MFRLLFGTALLTAPLPAAAQFKPNGPHSKRVQPKRSDLLACPDLRRIDYKAVAREAAAHPVSSDAEDRSAHARIRGPVPYPAIEDSTLILSAIGSPSITQDQPTYTSSILWRDSLGHWLMDRVNFIDPMDIPVPPDRPPYTPEEVSALQRRHSAGPLAADLASELDAALADRCFALEPDWLGLPIPAVRDGGPPYIEGYSGSGGSVRFRAGDRSWTMWHEDPRTQFRVILNAVLYAHPQEN
jgi:hypothetical protein